MHAVIAVLLIIGLVAVSFLLGVAATMFVVMKILEDEDDD